MKSKIFILNIVFIVSSCCQSNVEYVELFPLSEDELIEDNFGVLLEYAIFDSTKIDFVKNILCDSICKNQNLTFRKIETVINDSSYFFFYCREREFERSDYIGVLYFDINNLDTICLYSHSFRYGINDIDKIIEKIADYNKTSIDETVKYWKIGNQYGPNFYCIVEFDLMKCENGFIEKVIMFNRTLNKLMDTYSEKKFPNEKVVIRPYIEIRADLLLPPPRYWRGQDEMNVCD